MTHGGGSQDWNEDESEGNNWAIEAIQARSAWDYNNVIKEAENKINVGIVDGGYDTKAEDFLFIWWRWFYSI